MALVLGLGSILLGFGLGVLAVVAAEALGLLWIMKRLRSKLNRDQTQLASTPSQLDHQQSLHFALHKQGVVWVLESEKISKFCLDKQSKEQKRKTELLEVSPVKMYGQIKGQSLILRGPDDLHTTIELKGCTVQAVSASIHSSRKWAKKFPIKVESKTSVIYDGSKTLYVYLETSWEKEAWCKALNLASCDQEEKIKWFTQLHQEFHRYLTSLNSEYHSYIKPSAGSCVEAIERATKPDGSSSKVHQFLKKIAKKTSRVGFENKSTSTSLSGHEGKRNTKKLRASQDAILATGLLKTASTSNHLKNSLVGDAPPLSSKLSHSGNQNLHHVSSDGDADEKFGIDEGTLCWNLLISRLFFDAKGNIQLKRSMLARIQKTLSNMRIPSYIGEVICTDMNTGNVPPIIAGMRVLPMEMSEVWAVEVDIEYSGGAVLEIETRLEVRELELHAATDYTNTEPNDVGAVPSDLLEGFEFLGNQLNLAERENDLQEPKEDGDWNTDTYTPCKFFTYIYPLKNQLQGRGQTGIFMLRANNLSYIKGILVQVPLSLAIRVASLRGTLRLHIKPPPSDQLWYGFTSMPDIDFNLDSSVGEHKITSGYFTLLLLNRLKRAIWETLVLPNCESICIPWMLAEKDDWVPRNVAPFIWINQEFGNETSTSIDTNNQPYGRKQAGLEASTSTSSNGPEHKQQKPKSGKSSGEPTSKSSDSLALPLSSSGSPTLESSRSLEELTKPLLENDKPQETGDLKESRTPSLQDDKQLITSEQEMENNSEFQSLSRSVMMEKQNHPIEQENGLPKKMGKRERMLDLGKKMGEKLEEKRRHIEEKSRNIVEKMRGS
ncbi:Synaptotagmin-like mitochondrial-lipid-binding domain [Sesbania bispinosa]|nr:Synaptotagmin-like mitochondrial-lipid-binding domain [Sesbania bispinosa]